MDEPITARYVWDADELAEYWEAWAAYQRHAISPFLRLLLMLFYLGLSIGIPGWQMIDPRSSAATRWPAGVALVSLLVLLTVVLRKRSFLRWQARRVFRSMTNQSQMVDWTFTPEEIAQQTENSASTLLWTLFVKIVEVPNGFLLFQNATFFHWVPAHGFASESELKRFAELARIRVTNYVVYGACRFPAKPEPIGLDEI